MRKSASPKKFVAPRPTPNEVPYEPDFQYECDRCKVIVSPKKALKTLECIAYRKGIRCEGTLKRFGKGTGRGSHFKKETTS
jgi:hypothetical protein